MYQLIFEELRYDFQQKILAKGQRIKEECYNNHRKTLDGARQFAECITREKSNLVMEQKKGKFRLLHMEMSASKSQDFNLTQSVSQFIRDYQLDETKIEQNVQQTKS